MKSLYANIASTAKKYGASKVVLFGSRARGDNRERSDIDLAVFNMPIDNQILFSEEISTLPTLLDFDLVFIKETTSKALLDNIEKDGVILMSKFEDKKAKLVSAIQRLEEAFKDYDTIQYSTIRDGAIKRFEFCTELAWKTCREYLIEQGYQDINSPKAVMKQAFSDGIINDETVWLEILNSRNETAHIYDENNSVEIFNNIRNKYLKELKSLINKL